MSTHHQIQIGTSRHQPAQAAIATASTSKVPDEPDPVPARPPLFAHAYRGKLAQGTTSATPVIAADAASTSTTKKKASLAPGGSTFKTPITFKPKHGPIRSVHATLSDPRLRTRPNLTGGPDRRFETAHRLPKWGAEQLVVDDEEDNQEEMDTEEDDDDDGFGTTSDEEEDEDEDMYDVQMGRAQDDSGVGLLETAAKDMYEEEVKRKIRALERGPLINAYHDNLELATAQYSHVLDDMKTLLKRDLGEEVGQELRTQIEDAMEHRSKAEEALIQERDHFVVNVAEASVTQAQDLINHLYECHKQKFEKHKLYERNITSARVRAQATIDDALTKKYEQESSKVLKKMSTPSKASSTGAPSIVSAKAKGKGKARATR